MANASTLPFSLGAAVVLLAIASASVAGTARAESGPARCFGPAPQMPEPKPGWLPTLRWSVASEPWAKGATPKAAAGLAVAAFARDLKHPRWLYVLPNGDVLVAEAATEPESTGSVRGYVQSWVQRRSGAIAENANRISLLRDENGDGVAERQSVFLEGLRQPFGMALIGDQLYVANTDSVVRFAYHEGDTRIEA
jgi:glucose/arabinose dehydrogenase